MMQGVPNLKSEFIHFGTPCLILFSCIFFSFFSRIPLHTLYFYFPSVLFTFPTPFLFLLSHFYSCYIFICPYSYYVIPVVFRCTSLFTPSISNFLFYSSFCYSIWPRKFITTYFFSLYSPPYLLYLSLVISLSFPSLCKHLNSSDALAFHFKKSNPLLLYHFPFSFVFTLLMLLLPILSSSLVLYFLVYLPL